LPLHPAFDDGIVVVMKTNDYLSGDENLRPRELVWGVVREPPSPFVPHQQITMRISSLLYSHVAQHDLGTVLASPMDVVLDEANALVLQPDVMFISRERAGIVRDFVRGAPDLVVEVASSGTAAYDRGDKVRWYRAYGVRECWIVDTFGETIVVIDLAQDGVETHVRGHETIRSRVLPLFAHTANELFAG
jgi:Uma2 family endonuclease